MSTNRSMSRGATGDFGSRAGTANCSDAGSGWTADSSRSSTVCLDGLPMLPVFTASAAHQVLPATKLSSACVPAIKREKVPTLHVFNALLQTPCLRGLSAVYMAVLALQLCVLLHVFCGHTIHSSRFELGLQLCVFQPHVLLDKATGNTHCQLTLHSVLLIVQLHS